MEREYFDYHLGDNEAIIDVGGVFHYIVVVNSLKNIGDYAENYFMSTIDYGDWEDRGHTYKPGKIVNINRNCDGTYAVVFELTRVD